MCGRRGVGLPGVGRGQIRGFHDGVLAGWQGLSQPRASGITRKDQVDIGFPQLRSGGDR